MKIEEIIKREIGQEVNAETRLDSLGLDSLEFLELMLAVQTETGANIPDAIISSLDTVGDLAKAVDDLLASA